jgi:hypothetical protein
MEKTRLLEPPPVGIYSARNAIDRAIIRQFDTAEAWTEWLQSLESSSINWRCPWYDIPETTVSNKKLEWVVCAGLKGFSFYLPGRIMRQLGQTQQIEAATISATPSPGINRERLKYYRLTWHERKTVSPNPNFSVDLDDAYVAWLTNDVRSA